MSCASHAWQWELLHGFNWDTCGDFNAGIRVLGFLITAVTQNWQQGPGFCIYIYINSKLFLSIHSLSSFTNNPSTIYVSILNVNNCEAVTLPRHGNLVTTPLDGDLVPRQTLVLCKGFFKICCVNKSQEAAKGQRHRNKENIFKSWGLGYSRNWSGKHLE